MRSIARTLVMVSACAMLRVPATADAARDAHARVAITTLHVKMLDRTRNIYRPGTLTISRGDRVVWVNRGSQTHTATSTTWDSGRVAPGNTFAHRFRRAGTFRYHCTIHPEMTGTIIVQ